MVWKFAFNYEIKGGGWAERNERKKEGREGKWGKCEVRELY
jgi:hypothetical protein